MKALKILRPITDILILAMLVILQSTKLTGGNLHEITGMLLVVIFLVHISINMKMTLSMTKNFGKLKNSSRISLIVDFILILSMLVCIVSGVLTSQFLFNMKSSPEVLFSVHRWSGIASLLVSLVHLGFHLPAILAKINRVYDSKRLAALGEVIIYCCMVFVIGVYSLRDEIFSTAQMKHIKKIPVCKPGFKLYLHND